MQNEKNLQQSPDYETQFVSIQRMASILDVPVSWIYRQTMRRDPSAIPRVRLGKYVRFEPGKVLEWARSGQNR